jgi:hypothetical protein
MSLLLKQLGWDVTDIPTIYVMYEDCNGWHYHSLSDPALPLFTGDRLISELANFGIPDHNYYIDKNLGYLKGHDKFLHQLGVAPNRLIIAYPGYYDSSFSKAIPIDCMPQYYALENWPGGDSTLIMNKE